MQKRSQKPAIAIHGGAGVSRSNLSPAYEKEHLEVIRMALDGAYAMLRNGGRAVDAVEAAVVFLEDSPLFNAGKGSAFNADGKHELDAAIMDGDGCRFGGVASIRFAKNPIRVARLVMDYSHHILFAGKGADDFAKLHSADLVDEKYFYTEPRWQEFLAAKERNQVALDHEAIKPTTGVHKKFGTVGAVAFDQFGQLAAATSTGGLTNKGIGRIGDTPIPGAGTYANNKTLAISCTGRGEEFMRRLTSHSVSARMSLKKQSFAASCKAELNQLPDNCGGFVAIDKKGDIQMIFNTAGMFRGCVNRKGEFTLACF